MPPSPLQVGREKQLFLDHRFIERSDRVTLRVNPPAKKEIVSTPGGPWDQCGCNAYVFQEASRVRLYYGTHMHGDGMREGRLCYAESKDGIHFEKPNLGAVEFQGSRDNNIVFADTLDASPFLDPNADPAERWKLLYNHGYPALPRELLDPDQIGIYLAVSPDGFRWTRKPGRLLPYVAETHKLVHWDAARQRYVVHLRAIHAANRPRQRAIGRIETDAIDRPWPHEKGHPLLPPKFMQVLSSNQVPMVFHADEDDPPDTDVYAASPFKYPWAADAWLMFPSFYRHTPPPVGVDGNDGPISTQFACSRDGVTWSRPERVPYIRPGLSTEFDRGYNMVAAGMARCGDRIYQYYAAKGGTHHGRTDDLPPEERAKVAHNAHVRLEQRLDGFVSADAAYTGGRLTTPPIVFEGEALELNFDAESLGTARVEIRGEDDRALDGFALGDCEILAGNHVRKRVAWNGGGELGRLAGRPVRLHFEMRAAKLYAFQFV
jgi:hypothetical protein